MFINISNDVTIVTMCKLVINEPTDEYNKNILLSVLNYISEPKTNNILYAPEDFITVIYMYMNMT